VYALNVHAQMLRDPSYTPICDISAAVSCEAVLQSSYATVSGIPVAAGGAIWSALVLLLALAGMKGPGDERTQTTAGYVFVLSVVGLAAVFYLGYASFVVLQTLCVVCLTMYVAIIGIFLASSSATSASMGALASRFARDVRGMFAHPVSATLATSWIVGSVLLLAFFPREAPTSPEAQTAAAAAPVETLTPEQLQEWHAWLDAQPRESALAAKEPGKVVLVKFNDYQCPSCRMTWIAYRDIIARHEAQHPGVFTFETRDFPLESECGPVFNHYGACEAAVAARLAKEKGRGPEMEAWLYDNQSGLNRETVKEAAQRIAGVTDFDERYDDVLARVREDAQLGEKLGVTGTPTFFLNGIQMPGVRAAHFDAAIAYEIEKVKNKS
jgi:uncharacterized membrane protein/protein-disulfide isomerase